MGMGDGGAAGADLCAPVLRYVIENAIGKEMDTAMHAKIATDTKMNKRIA